MCEMYFMNFSYYYQCTFIEHELQRFTQVKLYIHIFIPHSVCRNARCSMQTKFCRICPRHVQGLNMPALGTSIRTISQFLPINIILPLLYTHISLIYDRRYVIVTTDSVFK